jgi:hypothetical protein
MKPGDCFTIEPALVQGSDSRGDTWDDGWTMSTLVCLLYLFGQRKIKANVSVWS